MWQWGRQLNQGPSTNDGNKYIQFPAKTHCSLFSYPPGPANLVGLTAGNDSETDPTGLISGRGEISHSWATESFFALHRALCLLHTLLVGKAEMWMVVVSGMALTIRSGAHISKGILKKKKKVGCTEE